MSDERYVMKIIAAADGGTVPEEGRYLASFDPDAHDGRGSVSTTADQRFALIFHSNRAAFDWWTMQSTVRPFRADGQPNRPLTAYTVEFVKVT
jgi:hypothetical protein